MKTTLLSIFLFISAFTVTAQTVLFKGTIRGTVIDSAKNNPLGFATVAITDARTKEPTQY